MITNGWGRWIRTTINGVRVQAVPLLLQRFFSNWRAKRPLSVNGLPAKFKPEKEPCPICSGLGFVSHDEHGMPPAFNVAFLNRHLHPNGRVTWEGTCRRCGGRDVV